MKRFLVLTGMLMALVTTVGCNCMRGRTTACAPMCAPTCAPACAPACAPMVSYGNDCAPSYGGGTISEPYMGSPTPAGTTIITPEPQTYTPAN